MKTKTKKTEPKTVEEQLAKYKRLARNRKQRIEEMEQDKADTIKALEDKHKEYLDDMVANHKRNQNMELDAYKHKCKYILGSLLAVIIILTITVFAVLEKAPAVRDNVSASGNRIYTLADTACFDDASAASAPVPAKTKQVKTATKPRVITSMAQWDSLEAAYRAEQKTKEADKRKATDTASTSP